MSYVSNRENSPEEFWHIRRTFILVGYSRWQY